MKKRSITLKDLAQKAGVSLMTVSRALRGTNGVGLEMREYIQNLAVEMGYIPYRSLYSLGGKNSSMTVGIVIPHLPNTIFPEMIQNMEIILSSHGYRILLFCNYNKTIKEFQDISALLERQTDGIIWAPLHMEESKKAAAMIMEKKCPLVFVDRKLAGFETDSAIVDDFQGARDAVLHLIAQHRTRIAFLRPKLESYVASERQKGFEAALQETATPCDKRLILKVGPDLESGREGVKILLQKGEYPDAIFCFNDPIAIGAEMELLAQGISIPDTIALAGFSNVLECEIAKVPLTTVYQDAAGLGQAAAELLLNRMLNPGIVLKPVTRILKTNLIVRESSVERQLIQQPTSPYNRHHGKN